MTVPPALPRTTLQLLPQAGPRRRLAAAVFCATSSDFPTNALIVRTRVRAGFAAFYCVLLLIKKLSFAVAPLRSPPELPSVPARTLRSRRGCRGQCARTRLLRSPRRPPPPAGLPPPPLPLAPTPWLQLRAPRLKNKQPRRRQLRALPPPGTPSGAGPVGPRSGAAAEGNAPRVGGRPCQSQASCPWRPGASRTSAPPGWARALRSGLRAPLGCDCGPQVSTECGSARARPLSGAGVLSRHFPPASPGPGMSWAGEPEAQVEECGLEKIWRFCSCRLQTRSSGR